jgi:hypothetical protein
MPDDTARQPMYRPTPDDSRQLHPAAHSRAESRAEPRDRHGGFWPPRAVMGGGDDDPVESGEDGPALARPRTRRARVWRLVLTLTVLALGLVVVVGGPLDLLELAARPSARGLSTIAPGITGPHLDATGWSPAPIPRGTQDIRTIDVHPSPADATIGYACWLTGGLGPVPESLHFSTSVDGERSWQAAVAPAAMASACQVIPDAAAVNQIVALVNAGAITTACVSSSAYASADGAQSWSPVAWPLPLRGACDAWRSVYGLNGRLYAWSPYYQLTTPRGAGALLYRSDDDGRSWRVVDPAPGSDTVAIIAGHADGSVLAVATPIPDTASGEALSPRLWSSPDGGMTWTALGTTPAATSMVYAAAEPVPPADGGWGTIYAVALPPEMEANAPVAALAIDMATANGWQPVRPLPVPDTSPSQPLGPYGALLGVGPGGVLLAQEVDTSDNNGINNGLLAPPHMIWGWDPGSRSWLPDYQTVPSNTEVEGFSWARPPGGPERIVILVFTINAGSPPFTGLFRSTLVAPKADTGVGGLGGSR